MEYLNAEELVEYAQEDGKGHNFKFYSLNGITNSPSVSVNIDTYKIKKCTCKFHSVKDVTQKSHCRFTLAVLGYIEKG